MKESRLAVRPCKASGCKQRNGKRRNTRHPSGVCEQCRTPTVENAMAEPVREKAIAFRGKRFQVNRLTKEQVDSLTTDGNEAGSIVAGEAVVKALHKEIEDGTASST